jgi:hypothetical protein
MVIVDYAFTVVVFCVCQLILPIVFVPVVWVYRWITRELVVYPMHPVMLAVDASSAFILMQAIQTV